MNHFLSVTFLSTLLLPALFACSRSISSYPDLEDPTAEPEPYVHQTDELEAWETLPFLTNQRQELVYGPGQTVIAFIQGFHSEEPVFVRLYHENVGLLEARQARTDIQGNLVLHHLVNPEEQKNFPTGKYWYQVENAHEEQRNYQFVLDDEKQVARHDPSTTSVLGLYPAEIVPGSIALFWCESDPGAAPHPVFSVDQGLLHPERIQTALYPAGPDQLLYGTFVVSRDDPAGEWKMQAGDCEYWFRVTRGTEQAGPSFRWVQSWQEPEMTEGKK